MSRPASTLLGEAVARRCDRTGRYRNSPAIRRTFAVVSSLIAGCPLSAREVVLNDNSAFVATSWRVTRITTRYQGCASIATTFH